MNILEELKSGKLKNNKEIKIASGLKDFPRELFQLEETLEVLDLTNNKLSHLPDDFYRFKKLKRLFLSNNQFNHVPKVLSKLPLLSMFGIRNNQIKIFEENSLPLSIRWLILTDNEIEVIPNSIGDLKLLQKCMLSGNKIKKLPKGFLKCKNLELLRISANNLETFPSFLLELPKLTWLAFSGNPFCKKHPNTKIKLKTISWEELEILELLGQGASGNIFKANYGKKEVAVKVFKGEMTSDGLPQEEMDINISMGAHPNLVDVLAKVFNHPEKKDALVLQLIDSKFFNLALPPSFESCTRDVYANDFNITNKNALKILKGIAKAAIHMHECFIMHGDFYGHNIMIDKDANSILGDFGGASYYELEAKELHPLFESLDVRAFGCLIEEMLSISKLDISNQNIREKLLILQNLCLSESPLKPPSFKFISNELSFI